MAKTKTFRKPRGRPAPAEFGGANILQLNRKRSQKARLKRVSWRDEQIDGMSVSDTPEFTDPAILAVCNSKIRYTRDQLMVLRGTALSQKKPDFLDVSEVPNQILDPEKWNIERKKSDTPTENGQKTGEVVDQRRRPGDARERIRKEDGIVLSPQRRSFNSGCFVPVTRTNRAHSPLGKIDAGHIGVRDIQPASRRIGSGRILRDWDSGEPKSGGDAMGEYGGFRRQNSSGSANNGDRGAAGTDDKFGGGRSFAGFDMSRDKDKDTRRNGGRYDRRRMDSGRDEEPEWFSGGPLSQNDTIELRGFDESDKPSIKMKRGAKRAKEWAKKKGDGPPLPAPDEKDESRVATSGRQTPAAPQVGAVAAAADADGGGQQSKGEPSTDGDRGSDHLSIFDDIFKADNISLLTNGVGADGDNKKSRFASWFKKESPEKDSRRSSIQDENSIVKGILNDLADTSVTIPGDADSYFAPISPAANTGGVIGKKAGANHAGALQNKSVNIMEMLQRGQTPDDGAKQLKGKFHNLDEIEAKMRQSTTDLSSGMPHKPQLKPEEDMTAFKRLLAQVTGGHAITATNGPVPKSTPMSLMEMLQHSQQQDEAARRGHIMGPVSPGLAGLQQQNEMAIKLQQAHQQQQKQQLDMFSKLLGSAQMRGASPLHDIGVQQSRELLNRPEAQAILHGLNCGDLTPQHIYQQLGNPGLQPRHKEMLSTILKYGCGGAAAVGPSPRVLSPVPPPQHMFPMQPQQTQQQLRVSPLPPNAMHQRIPSPRELQIHTQNILQKALIKKKLEEQTENYRKKQEQQQRGQSPNTNGAQAQVKSVASPTPLAFTPTSVLRKMTADKDEGKENKIDGKAPQGRPLTGMRPQVQQPPPPVQQWNQQYASLKQPAGRPIVKANPNYHQSQNPAEFFNQQRIYNQLQQAQQQQQQQRKIVPQPGQGQYVAGATGMNNNNNPGLPPHHSHTQFTAPNPSPSFSTQQQLTQHQLRAQHQQRAPPLAAQASAVVAGAAAALPGQHGALQQQMGYQQQQQASQQQTWQQFLSNAQHNNRNNPIGRGGGAMDGDLSPTTTNQLARWFSPDLLERARGGELPSTAGLAQQVLSLEEIERQTAPPVHN